MPFRIPVREKQHGSPSVARRKKLSVDGVVFRPGRANRTRESQNIIGRKLVIVSGCSGKPFLAGLDCAMRISTNVRSRIGIRGVAIDVLKSPDERLHPAIVIRGPPPVLVASNSPFKPVHRRVARYSLPHRTTGDRASTSEEM